jgi:hypothetical protein
VAVDQDIFQNVQVFTAQGDPVRWEMYYPFQGSQAIQDHFYHSCQRSVCIWLMLTRSRWITIKPRSSPLYALAAAEDSEKDPIILLRPLVHSSTNAAEHSVGEGPSFCLAALPISLYRGYT